MAVRQRRLTAARIEDYPEYKWVVLFLPIAYVLSPRIPILGLDLRLGDAALFAAIFLRLLPVWYERTLNVHTLDRAFAVIFASMAVTFIASIVAGGRVGLRDIYEFPKVFLYWCAYQCAATMRWDRRDLRTLARIGIAVSSVVAVICLLQSMGAFSVNEWLSPLFMSQTHILKILTIGRTPGTLQNPNYAGLFLAAALLAGFLAITKVLFTWDQRSTSRTTSLGLAAWVLLIATAFMLAASRTALLALIVVLPVMSVVVVRRQPPGERGHAARAALVAFVLLIVVNAAGLGIARVLPKFEPSTSMDLFRRVDVGIEQVAGDMPDTSSSLHERIMRWSFAAERWSERPIFGWGPAKTSEENDERPPTDNEYLLYMERYGIIGLVAYVLLYYALLREAWRAAHREPYETEHLTPLDLAWLNLGIVGLLLVFNLMAGSFYNLQLFPLVVYLHGFMVSLSWDALATS